MTKRYNMNEMSWKGKTFFQITSSIQPNKNQSSINNRFLPPPLKIYRKEIASTPITICSKKSISINELDIPNGYLVYSTPNSNGLTNTLDINLSENKNNREQPICNLGNPTCKTSINTMSPSVNALRKIRSSGMIRNNSFYYTSNAQYMASRNLTYKQNQYQYVSNVIIPETVSTGNINNAHCKNVQTPVYNPNNKQFAQQGAVSSSSLVTRLKYNTITTAGSSLRTAFGANTANALAYNTSFVGYTVKDKVGYPLHNYPTFNKYSSEFKQSCDVSLRG